MEKSSDFYRYLLDGLTFLICSIMIKTIRKISKGINKNGVLRICRNVFALQQNITNIVTTVTRSKEDYFDRVRRYFRLLLLSEEVRCSVSCSKLCRKFLQLCRVNSWSTVSCLLSMTTRPFFSLSKLRNRRRSTRELSTCSKTFFNGNDRSFLPCIIDIPLAIKNRSYLFCRSVFPGLDLRSMSNDDVDESA